MRQCDTRRLARFDKKTCHVRLWKIVNFSFPLNPFTILRWSKGERSKIVVAISSSTTKLPLNGDKTIRA